MEHGPVFVSVRHAAARLGVGRSTFYKFLATGQIRALALGGRTVVRADELAMFAEGLPQLAFKAPTAARKKQSSGS